MVNQEPYCIWEIDLSQRNREFLDGIDVEYFDYAIKVHLDASDEKRAAVAMRLVLHHATETLFSLLGAYIQATDCAYAWIAKCSNRELREFVAAVGSYENKLFTKLNIQSVSWSNVSESIFRQYMPGTERRKDTVRLFASLWHRLANEYLDQNHVDEYNSLKHGFRVRPGGFSLMVGTEHEYGVPPPADEMKLVGKSEYGTSFLRVETIGGRKASRSLHSRNVSINWEIEKVALLAQLASASINNVISAIKIANDAEAGTCKFVRPQNDEDFERPWQYSPGVTVINMDFVINENDIVVVSKDELLERLKELAMYSV